MEISDYLHRLSDDIEAAARALEIGPMSAPIAGCPGWTLLQLGAHLGGVHRWARHAIIHSEPLKGESDDQAPDDPTALPDWLRAGGDRLLTTLRSIDPNATTWHPFPVPKVAGVWPRRQAHETSVHRWDAENAVGLSATIDAEMAADGIDEYLGVMLPRMLSREGLVTPPTVWAISTSDTGDQWLVEGSSGTLVAIEDREPDALVVGPAAAVLLRLWGRPVPSGVVSVRGDPAAAAAWLALGGA